MPRISLLRPEVPSSCSQPDRRADARIHDLFLARSVLLARVLTRNQGLAEPLRARAAGRVFGPPVRHEDLDPRWLYEVDRVPRARVDDAAIRAAVASGQPTVLEGPAESSRAVQEWTVKGLASRFGGTRIPMFRAHGGRDSMSLAECVEHLTGNHGNPDVQINNACDLLVEHPELLEDLPIGDLRRAATGLRYHGANLFVCRSGSGSKYHCANEVNFFVQVRGRKEWFFVHPRHSARMDPRFTVPRCNYFGSGLAWGEQPRGVPIGRALLEPGDVLVNPPWWWHWVRNRDLTIGVATRWMSWRHRFGTANPYFTALQWLFPHQWRLLWTDYVKGGRLEDAKWVHPRADAG